jgi:hypothetical protein
MKLQEMFKAYEFGEIYPEVGLMFQPARHHREEFRHAYEMIRDGRMVPSKKQIKYQLMEDPDTKEMFYGADDNNFNGPWDVLAGKEVKRDAHVDLTDAQIAANCLLCCILIGRHPKEFDKDYQNITKR